MEKSRLRQKTGYRRPIIFWGGLILALMLISLIARVVLGLRGSAAGKLSRVNLLYQGPDKEVILSLEGNSAVYYQIPADLRPIPLPILGRIESNDQTRVLVPDKAGFKRLFWQTFRRELKTDLSKYDFFWLYVKSFKLKNEQISLVEGHPDLVKYFKDSRVRNESLSIGVVNSTKFPGLAAFASGLIENCGGRIIKVADSPEGLARCQIVVDQTNRSYTRTWLSLAFGCEEKYTSNDGRVDLTLILGEEDWKKLSP